MKPVGSRAEVFHGNAKRTSGRLVKDDLMKNKAGRIVSKQKHAAGKVALKYLHAKGYIAVKGKFGSARKAEVTPPVAPVAPVAPVVPSDSLAEIALVDNLELAPGGVGPSVAVAPVATAPVLAAS
jgi:hypothetical protein